MIQLTTFSLTKKITNYCFLIENKMKILTFMKNIEIVKNSLSDSQMGDTRWLSYSPVSI